MGCLSNSTLKSLQLLAKDIQFASRQPAGEIHTIPLSRAWLCGFVLMLQLFLFGHVHISAHVKWVSLLTLEIMNIWVPAKGDKSQVLQLKMVKKCSFSFYELVPLDVAPEAANNQTRSRKEGQWKEMRLVCWYYQAKYVKWRSIWFCF